MGFAPVRKIAIPTSFPFLIFSSYPNFSFGSHQSFEKHGTSSNIFVAPQGDATKRFGFKINSFAFMVYFKLEMLIDLLLF